MSSASCWSRELTLRSRSHIRSRRAFSSSSARYVMKPKAMSAMCRWKRTGDMCAPGNLLNCLYFPKGPVIKSLLRSIDHGINSLERLIFSGNGGEPTKRVSAIGWGSGPAQMRWMQRIVSDQAGRTGWRFPEIREVPAVLGVTLYLRGSLFLKAGTKINSAISTTCLFKRFPCRLSCWGIGTGHCSAGISPGPLIR